MSTTTSFLVRSEELIRALQNSKTTENGLLRIENMKVDFLLDGVDDKSISQKEEVKITPDDYYKFGVLVKSYDINLKDIRDIIRLSYSWWSALRSDPRAEEYLIFRYHMTHKDLLPKDLVYSEDLLKNTLYALSICENPVCDFYSRIKRVKPWDYEIFEEFYKTMYPDEPEK